MSFKLALLSFVFAAFTVQAAEMGWWTSRNSCAGPPSLDYKNLGCNVCVDPNGDWFAAQVTGVSGDQRISMHNENSCTPASMVGQFYGNVCANAGGTALRSVWIACAGQALVNNATSEVPQSDWAHSV